MLSKLKDYYTVNRIATLNFDCKHYKSCKGNSNNFATAREAFVGSKYEEGSKYPRILFISLDPGFKWKPEENTLEAVRDWEENNIYIEKIKGREKNYHWYRTHELTWMILNKFEPDIKIAEIKPYFAHTNSAKCCLEKEYNWKADIRLFENCREYIPNEVILLDPDVVITQGNEAKDSIKASLKPIESGEFKNYLFQLSSEKKILWFHTYHPRRFGDFNRQRREHFDDYANLIYQFYST